MNRKKKKKVWDIEINSPLEYFAFKLCFPLQVYTSRTINDMKSSQGTKPGSKVINLH